MLKIGLGPERELCSAVTLSLRAANVWGRTLQFRTHLSHDLKKKLWNYLRQKCHRSFGRPYARSCASSWLLSVRELGLGATELASGILLPLTAPIQSRTRTNTLKIIREKLTRAPFPASLSAGRREKRSREAILWLPLSHCPGRLVRTHWHPRSFFESSLFLSLGSRVECYCSSGDWFVLSV